MHHWDRGISGRLQIVSTPTEQGYEVSVHSDQMDPLPEEQQSQQGGPVNPTAYRSMRDHIHPPRVSAPSCMLLDEAMDFLNYVAKTSKAWDEPNPREAERMRPSTHQRVSLYALSEDTEMKAKLTTLTRRLEELEMRNQHEVQVVNELPASQPACFNCQSSSHPGEHCLLVPSVRDLMQEHAHVLGQEHSLPTHSKTLGECMR